MTKIGSILVVISLVAVTPWAQSFRVESWTTKLEAKQETVTNLQFYFHDTVSGKNPSAIRVAQAADTEKSLTLFGALLVADDPLTETPDPNSKLLGRAQGLYGSVGKTELGLIMALSFCFSDGIYNGSSISILGKNSALSPVREMPIVGGTGLFRLARGFAGKNVTAVRVAHATSTAKSPTSFGLVFIMDDPLTEGLKPTSKALGRAQGLYAFSGREELSLLMAFNLVFTTGEYNGSTLTVLGRNPAVPHREMPIIGGSGIFRLVRGVALAKLRSFNMNTGNALIEYNVVVIHY
ncbi:hypothetical protein CRYUN_Cryun10bG0143100 [Craigia yunnanensis]